MFLNLVQVKLNENIFGAKVSGSDLELLNVSIYDLAMSAANKDTSISKIIDTYLTGEVISYDQAIIDGLIVAPISHPDSHKQILSGTGLTHLGSAAPRSKMHSENVNEASKKQSTDTERMFQLGLEGGKGTLDQPGVAPEWFYKGTGESVNAPFSAITMPEFSLDAGEEAELAGIYIVNTKGKVFRVGYSLANEFSDHVTEKKNYLYLAHSKLRNCSFGPEIFIGDLPEEVTGTVSLSRGDEQYWHSEFLSGEKHMCHSIENLEYHHFKYEQFRQPGQLHVHFFGAAVLSFSQGISIKNGDVISMECSIMTRPLRNTVEVQSEQPIQIDKL
jgi:hypothetical protein